MKLSLALAALAGAILAPASPIAVDIAAPEEADAALAARATTTAIPVPTNYPAVALQAHNIHRANHSAPAAVWNANLAQYAATVAARCVFAHDTTVGKAATGSYGQNIAVYGSTGNIAAVSANTWISKAVTNQWYNDELPHFPAADYGKPTPDLSNFAQWGHFSQIVWAGSTQIGCASQYCPKGTIFANMASYFSVCNYRSPGNVASLYGKNVLPPLRKATVVA